MLELSPLSYYFSLCSIWEGTVPTVQAERGQMEEYAGKRNSKVWEIQCYICIPKNCKKKIKKKKKKKSVILHLSYLTTYSLVNYAWIEFVIKLSSI